MSFCLCNKYKRLTREEVEVFDKSFDEADCYIIAGCKGSDGKSGIIKEIVKNKVPNCGVVAFSFSYITKTNKVRKPYRAIVGCKNNFYTIIILSNTNKLEYCVYSEKDADELDCPEHILEAFESMNYLTGLHPVDADFLSIVKMVFKV